MLNVNCYIVSRLHFALRVFLTGVFFVTFHSAGFAQESMQITGTVIDAQSKKPLAGASIYLDNTTRATVSSDSGRFVLRNIPSGNYKLIISFVGYNSAAVSINEQSAHSFRVELVPAEKILNEVIIKANPHWEEYYMLFKSFFLGKAGADCSIQNPKILFFDYNDKYVLTAEADRPLIIDNHTLGYRLYYDLTSFVHYAGRTSYSGHTRFEEMKPGNSKEQKKWKRNREKAYYGSSTHFMRSLVNQELAEDGFIVRKMEKASKTSRHHPVLVKMPAVGFKSPDTIAIMRWDGFDYIPGDSVVVPNPDNSYNWSKRTGYNILYPDDVLYDSIVSPVFSAGNYRLSFKNSLFITYKKKRNTSSTSILTMLMPETFMDIQGNLADPNAVLNEGYWATLRVADQLPFDYEPEEEGKSVPVKQKE